jgi:hypothetical protein
MGNYHASLTRPRPTDNPRGETMLTELHALRRDVAGLTQRLDEFARVYLEARFPYGKPVDRWRRRG